MTLNSSSRSRPGNEGAYRYLVERYQQRVVAVVYGMLGNREDAAGAGPGGLRQGLPQPRPGFQSRSSFYTWLYRIAVNLAIDFRRREWKKRNTEFEDSRMQNPHSVDPHPNHTAFSPSKTYENAELKTRIMAAIDKLPEDQRTVVVLREIEGLSYKEIAEVVGCPEGTVMSRLYYGRKKLQTMLAGLR